MFDLVVKNASVCGHKDQLDIGITKGKIVKLGRIEETGVNVIDAAGYLVTSPFVDAHFHMDSTLTFGRPRVNQSGTLLEGIGLWRELKPTLDVAEFKERALRLCRWSVARGTLMIRSHVDISDAKLLNVKALLEVRESMRDVLDIQLVAFPQDGFLRSPDARKNLLRALDMGVDVVGGIPHFERTMNTGAQAVKELCEIAAERGLQIDMHCDESDDPLSRHIESLTYETSRLNLQGRVAASHLTSMHSMDNYYVSKLMPLMREAQINVIANPLINITLQARHDTYPKRRGMTRVKELMAAGINVAFGHDCVMDPWYPLGSHDMLEVAHMGLHVGQMTGISEMESAFDAVTTNAAKAMGLKDYGIEVGNSANLVVLQCQSKIDALRLRPPRLYVIKNGNVIARTAKCLPEIVAPSLTPSSEDFCL